MYIYLYMDRFMWLVIYLGYSISRGRLGAAAYGSHGVWKARLSYTQHIHTYIHTYIHECTHIYQYSHIYIHIHIHIVIATYWSGPTAYLTQENGYPLKIEGLIDAELVAFRC